MSFDKVEDWLRSLGLICYAQAFYDNGYEDIETCQSIGEADLDVIGVKNPKDRNDILANLIRLKQNAFYFEVEPDALGVEEIVVQEREKLDPLLLKTKIKDELEKRNIQLTEPPYFNLNGSFGDLKPLAELISFDLNTITDDVLVALDQMRRRQLPAETYAQLANELKDDQDPDFGSEKHLLKDDDPQEYLNVEVGARPRRATSLSKYDKRITKSTSNLTSIGDKKGPVIEPFKGQPKKHAAGKKSHGLSKFFSSMRRTKSPMLDEKGGRSSLSDINAGDIAMSQDELRKIMTKVKNQELSQDDALNEVHRRTMARVKSKSFDGETIGSVFDSSPETSPKEKEDARDRKKKEKSKKKKTVKGKKSIQNSVFYSDGCVSDEAGMGLGQHLQLMKIHSSPVPGTGSKIEQNQNGCDESPDLTSFNRDNKSSIKNRLKRSFRRNGRSPVHGDDSDAFRSTETLNSSTGSTHSSSQDSIVSGELQDTNSDVPLIGQLKQIKRPPPIPVREDILHPSSKLHVDHSTFGINNQHRMVRQVSKSMPVPPPRNITVGRQEATTQGKTQGERARSVTFNDSILVNDGMNEVTNMVARNSSTTSLTFVPKTPDTPDFTLGNVIATGEVTKNVPTPPPRPLSRKSSSGSLQGDQSGPPPVAPPRLKRQQKPQSTSSPLPGAEPSVIAQTSTDKSYKDNGVSRIQPESDSNIRIANDQKDLTPLNNRDRNQNTLIVEHHKTEISKMSSNDTQFASPAAYDTKSNMVAGKPMPKPKPSVPPRPISTIGGGPGTPPIMPKPPPPPRSDLANNDQAPSNSPSLSGTRFFGSKDVKPPVPPLSSKPFRPRPLKDLVKKKLRKESIDIAQRPYTTEGGEWNVPFALLQRYSEELEKPVEDVATAMDSIRQDMLNAEGNTVVPCDISTLKFEPSEVVPKTASVDDWLIVTGLPMFSEDFKEVGLTTFGALKAFPVDEFKNIGVYDQRHVTRLLKEIQKL